MATTTVELHVRNWAEAVYPGSHLDEDPYYLEHEVAPVIEMNGKAFPKPKDGLKAAHGFQLIAIDAAKDMTDPASVLVNEYHYSFAHYEVMYRQMIHALLSAGDPARQRVLVVSFGMAAVAAPPVEACKYLIWLGAGKKLQEWVTGTQMDPNYHMEHLACYVLVGSSGSGYGQGVEGFTRSDRRGASCSLDMKVTLHNPQPAPRQPHPVHAPRPAAVT